MKYTITTLNFKNVITLHLGWKYHIKDLLIYVQGHMSITDKTKSFNIPSQELIFTLYMYQVRHKSLLKQCTHILHNITYNIPFYKHIGPTSVIYRSLYYLLQHPQSISSQDSYNSSKSVILQHKVLYIMTQL